MIDRTETPKTMNESQRKEMKRFFNSVKYMFGCMFDNHKNICCIFCTEHYAVML